MFIDSHCHLDRIDLTPYDGCLEKAVDAARERGVSEMLCIGIDLGNAQTVVDIAHRFDGIYATVGVHPMDVNDAEPDMAALEALAGQDKVLAIGETGLDYHYSADTARVQQASFQHHLTLAATLDKPVVVHTREARADTLALLRDYAAQSDAGGVLHCFTESWDMARAVLDLGFYISFSGIVTFRSADTLRDVVRKVPSDRLLIETDSPYLAPVPYRGRKNEPQYVVEVAECVAHLQDMSVETLAETTANNFYNLFF